MSNSDLSTPIVSFGIHAGIEWETRLHAGLGATNGYARLPEGHPLRSLDLQWDDASELSVHGGITYGPTDDGWVGFDTSHFTDIWPMTPDFLKEIPSPTPKIFWTHEMVESEARDLCEQIAATKTKNHLTEKD